MRLRDGYEIKDGRGPRGRRTCSSRFAVHATIVRLSGTSDSRPFKFIMLFQ